jgi:hypothetical protein
VPGFARYACAADRQDENLQRIVIVLASARPDSWGRWESCQIFGKPRIKWF